MGACIYQATGQASRQTKEGRSRGARRGTTFRPTIKAPTLPPPPPPLLCARLCVPPSARIPLMLSVCVCAVRVPMPLRRVPECCLAATPRPSQSCYNSRRFYAHIHTPTYLPKPARRRSKETFACFLFTPYLGVCVLSPWP